MFNDLHLTPDLVLVVRMYLREDRRYNHSAGPDARDTAGDRNEEKLIAWAAMHLVRHSKFQCIYSSLGLNASATARVISRQ